MLERIKSSIGKLLYQSSASTPKERLAPSHNLILLIIISQFVIYQLIGCPPISILSTIFLLLSLVAYILFLRGFIRISTYSLYFLTAAITAFDCYFLGWTFGYSLFSLAIIPILYYYIYVMDGLEKSLKIGSVIAVVHLTAFSLLRFFVYRQGAIYKYSVYEAYIVSLINWITCGLLIVYFCVVFVLAIRDMREALEEKNSRLAYLALYDSLTGFRNRQSIGDDLNRLMRESKENHTPFTILLADIDDFKEINDTYGHAQGDKVLTRLSSVFLESMPSDALVCRWGGEEFLIALPYNLDASKSYANAIRHRLEEIEFRCGGQAFHITVTFGVQPMENPDTTFEALIQAADDNLYSGKRRGKNCIAYQNFIWRY